MNKDITNPGNKAISYAATLSSVVSLLPVRKPGTPSFCVRVHRPSGRGGESRWSVLVLDIPFQRVQRCAF